MAALATHHAAASASAADLRDQEAVAANSSAVDLSEVAISSLDIPHKLTSDRVRRRSELARAQIPSTPASLVHEEIELPGDALLRVGIRDAGNKLDLNALIDSDGKRIGENSKNFLKAVLAHIRDTVPEFKGSSKLGDQDIDELADAILDWLDRRDVERPALLGLLLGTLMGAVTAAGEGDALANLAAAR